MDELTEQQLLELPITPKERACYKLSLEFTRVSNFVLQAKGRKTRIPLSLDRWLLKHRKLRQEEVIQA